MRRISRQKDGLELPITPPEARFTSSFVKTTKSRGCTVIMAYAVGLCSSSLLATGEYTPAGTCLQGPIALLLAVSPPPPPPPTRGGAPSSSLLRLSKTRPSAPHRPPRPTPSSFCLRVPPPPPPGQNREVPCLPALLSNRSTRVSVATRSPRQNAFTLLSPKGGHSPPWRSYHRCSH